MGTDTGIQWTDSTWNPIRGCSRVSEGCRHCYAETVAARFSGTHPNGKPLPYRGLAVYTPAGEPHWTGKVVMVPERFADPVRWQRPRRVFVNSMSDLFHERLTNEQIASVFGVMAVARRHTFQVLTKRADRMADWFRWVAQHDEGDAWTNCHWEALQYELANVGDAGAVHTRSDGDVMRVWPLPNVHLGVSVEHQGAADERIPRLMACPALVRWVSYEPALGPVDWRRHVDGLDWVVVGGESGAGARRFDVQWAVDTVTRCQLHGVPVFVKQMGSRPVDSDPRAVPGAARAWPQAVVDRGMWRAEDGAGWVVDLLDDHGGDPSEWPEVLRVRQMPTVLTAGGGT